MLTDETRARGDDRVAEGREALAPGGRACRYRSGRLPNSGSVAGSFGPSVHPSGNPIRHSTQAGLRWPPSLADSDSRLGAPFVAYAARSSWGEPLLRDP
jgi:hypothetical protein